jgi:hypothetical protein
MVRSMQGKEVDMEKLVRQHELMPAVGNVRVNARGDELGPGGQIVRKREDIVAEYYESNPKAKSGLVKTKTDDKSETKTEDIAVTSKRPK